MPFTECLINPSATLRRERLLPVAGRIVRHPGEQVSSDTVVAIADVPAGYRLLELERELGRRVTDTRRVMVKKVGAEVKKGEVIARAGLLFKSECRSPVDGRILDARAGKVLIQVAPEHVELTAFYPGRITDQVMDRGVVIETHGAIVQGAWGTGREVRGRLEVIVTSPEAALNADQVLAAYMGMVIVGGRTLDAEALERAVQNQVSGVIVGSISSELLPAIRAAPLTVIVTEGFGDRAMSELAFEVLQAHAGEDACLDPHTQTRWQVHRPEVVIPLQRGDAPPLETGTTLQVGDRVRVVRPPHAGKIGTVVAIPPHHRRVESGIRTPGAEVELESAGRRFIPLLNLEVIR